MVSLPKENKTMKKLRLEKNIGLWLDQEKAYIITLNRSRKASIEKFVSDVESRIRDVGEKKPYTQFETTYSNDEGRKQRRQKQEREHYFEKLINVIHDADYIYLFGPGQAKEELKNAIEKDHSIHAKLIRIGTADRLTENQMIAAVKKYYASDEFINRRNELGTASKEINL
jgi:hypothetical protein